ncbi:hypothetical protein L9G74_18030 [Shewanella sp. C32]|uniref:Uncharacterized protein n=1 Tax=Shewanella electrica TaxID=515560 RepID=A0ABT2FPS3_9GAMM|nr:hypothetical protein [Shewanella electrica]MCH1926782.1 hypothetical protein [Shewanella electrica]MCS4558343.1 hypothetical protein [Shewanella electrica]
MTANELEQVLRVLHANSPKGVDLERLAKASDISVKRLQQFIKSHREYFVIMPDSDRYQINRFGQLKGNISAIVQHYQQRHVKSKKTGNWIWLAVIFTTSMTLFTALHNQ